MTMNYKLFQIKKDKIMNATYAFQDAPKSSLKELNFFDNYELAYTGGIDLGKSIESTLDSLFVLLNTNKRPSDYNCRSMSVSDIIMIGNEFYYCEVFGFKQLSLL